MIHLLSPILHKVILVRHTVFEGKQTKSSALRNLPNVEARKEGFQSDTNYYSLQFLSQFV